MSEGKLVEQQAVVDLYMVVAHWMIALYTAADEEVAPPEVVADRLRKDFPRQNDQEAVERMMAAARAVTGYVVDCVLTPQIGIRTPHKAGHA